MLGFGSTHVYKYDSSDDESFSDEEYEKGLNLDCVASDNSSSASSRLKVNKCKSCLPKCRRPPPPPSVNKSQRKATGVRQKINWLFRRHSGASEHSDIPHVESVERDAAGLPNKLPSLKKKRQNRYRRADTNVVTVQFKSLIKPSCMHTGEAERCSSCPTFLSHLSKLIDTGKENEKSWTCEFCGCVNLLDLMPDEVPQVEDVTYMLEPAPTTLKASISGHDESLVIFCIDISGSMCMTTEVTGKLSLRGDHTAGLQALNTEHENQYMPGQRIDVTYVSRLQGVQAAVDQQMEALVKEHPDRRVALIAFNNEVVIYGDGSNNPVHLAEHRLSDKDDLVKMASEAILPKAIKKSFAKLSDTVFDLDVGGATALGPALIFSVALACQVPGSKVIVCTDGMANVGLGALDTGDLETAAMFYTEVADIAVAKGVSVSIISIKGTSCRMEELGSVADATGGQVNIVDPLHLTEEFGNILADPIIATNVTATFIVHKELYIREDGRRESSVLRHIGNVTLNTEITFEYGIQANKKKPMFVTVPETPKEETVTKEEDTIQEKSEREETEEAEEREKASMDKVDTTTGGEELAGAEAAAPSASSASGDNVPNSPGKLDNLTELPFQLQITYTDMDGAKAQRVITQCKPITTKREVAEKNMDMNVLGVYTAQRSAGLAQNGMYLESRFNAFTNNHLVQNYMHHHDDSPVTRDVYMGHFRNVQGLERELKETQQEETLEYGQNLDDMINCDGLAEIEYGSTSKQKKQLRIKSRTDTLAKMTYNMKKSSHMSSKK